jgi:hypothetical protein
VTFVPHTAHPVRHSVSIATVMLGSTTADSCEQYSNEQDFLRIRHEIILREVLEYQNLLVNDVFPLKKEGFRTSTGLIRQGPEFSAERGEYGTESRMFLKMETEQPPKPLNFASNCLA